MSLVTKSCSVDARISAFNQSAPYWVLFGNTKSEKVCSTVCLCKAEMKMTRIALFMSHYSRTNHCKSFIYKALTFSECFVWIVDKREALVPLVI